MTDILGGPLVGDGALGGYGDTPLNYWGYGDTPLNYWVTVTPHLIIG